jgi:heme-degrading monooxygenase HmoA
VIICLFGQRYRNGADTKEEERLSDELMRELTRMAGFISYHSYRADDGELLGVIRFESREALDAWRNHPAHQAVWSRADEFYDEFWIQNVETFREYVWAGGKRREEDMSERFRESGVG